MTSTLGGDAIVLHVPPAPKVESLTRWKSQLRYSLDELRPFAQTHQVRIALENMVRDNFEMIDLLLADYAPDFLGFCYDSGHGNVDGLGLDHPERLKDRLVVVHLHDNDGSGDQHKLLFDGKVDWERLSKIIAASAYKKCVSMEVNMRNTGLNDEDIFLQKAFLTGQTLTKMIESKFFPLIKKQLP
jgi:sugar phosphate isomerase/epimerase